MQLASRSSGRPGLRGPLLCLLAVLALLLPAPAHAGTTTPLVYQGHVYSSGAGAASADKPQSKLWYHDGSWWALMVNAAGTVNVFELEPTHTWRDTGTIVDERTTSTGDALLSGGSLYVASRTAGSSGAVRVHRFSYSAATRTWSRAGSPYSFPGGGTESVVIDADTTGRLWVTFTRGSTVLVSHTTDAAQTAWSSPYRIAGADTSVSSDDISTVIAFDGKVGVLWSDQASHAVRFAHRLDSASPTSWVTETVLSGTGLADDHLNIKSLQGDDEGRLYAAVKTSLTASTDPVLLLLTRTAAGSWSAATTATVADKLTRPQVALDKTNRVIHVLQSTESGGSVYAKSATLSDRPSFGPGKGDPFITWSGAKINDVSTSKDPVTSTTGLVAIATDRFAKRYYHAELAVPGTAAPDTTPPPAPAVTPDSGTYTSAQSVSMTSSETGTVIRYTVGTGTTAPADPTATSAQYTGPIPVSSSQVVKAAAFDAAGNRSPITQRSYTIDTTTTSPSDTSRTVVLEPTADTMVRQNAATTSFGSATTLTADAQSGTSTSSRESAYLRFTIPTLAAGETITAASLSVNSVNGSSNGPSIYRTDPAWTESTMTWNSGQPARSSNTAVGDFGSVGTGRVSTAVAGTTAAGDVSFQVHADSSDGVDFSSREATNRPRLTLTITASGTTTSPSTADTTAPPAPTVTPASGTYASAQSVSMTSSETGSVIRYTVGTGTAVPEDPTPTSAAYTGPLTVSTSQVLKARAYDAAGNASGVTRADYVISAAPTPTTRQVVLQPVADTSIEQAQPSVAFGSVKLLQADTQDVSGTAGTAVHSLLRFVVPTLAEGESITAAALSLQVTNGTSNGPAVWRTGAEWTESGTTWATGRPLRSGTTPVADYGSMSVTRVSTPVAGVTGAGDVSFELVPQSTNGVDIASREDTTSSRRPTLVLTVTSG